MSQLRSLLAVVLAALCLAACGLDHSTLTADIRTKTPQIALDVHDKRPYVVKGSKKETFVGVTRGGYYNPFDLPTMSGKPLADDMAKAVAASLGRNGTSVTIVTLEPSMSREAAIARLAQTGQRGVLLTMPFGYATPEAIFERNLPPIFKKHMEELFSAPSVAGAH